MLICTYTITIYNNAGQLNWIINEVRAMFSYSTHNNMEYELLRPVQYANVSVKCSYLCIELSLFLRPELTVSFCLVQFVRCTEAVDLFNIIAGIPRRLYVFFFIINRFAAELNVHKF